MSVFIVHIRLGVIPAIKAGPRVALRKVTEFEFINVIGTSLERRSLQYRIHDSKPVMYTRSACEHLVVDKR